MTFDSLLQKYREFSFSERDKGSRFELLMQAWLQTDPLYKDRFKHVWMWNEFPFRQDFGGKDTGIDLVAQTQLGDFWAIQCKCFDEQTYIDKPAVDSFLATSSKTFQQATRFSNRLWISTTNKWGSEAENTIHNQHPPVQRISLSDLASSPVDWESLENGVHGEQARAPKKTIRLHQTKALTAAHEHFSSSERGRMIMACGTGKTYTSLKIAENETGGTGLVLFLVPSIALLGQTLREWSAESVSPLNAICVCSDVEVSRKKTKSEDFEGFSIEDLALPASTDAKTIADQLLSFQTGFTVIFSTYQSIEAVARAQSLMNQGKADSCIFDLIICDEAHRTTGVTLVGEDESAFVKVHDNTFLPARKRLYMTATPRLYNEETQRKAVESDALLCSMDDVSIYGEEFYRIGFGEAVDKQLLADYKVLVLTLSEGQIPAALQEAISDGKQEINTDDASKLIGCINALSKRMLLDAELLVESDPEPMRRAVAFCQSIKVSKKITGVFNTQKDVYYQSLTPEDRAGLVTIEANHVDGTMGAATRDEKLSWLKSVPSDAKDCRILTNVRCLSEGVDVPSLDAVLFLSARNSQIDVVQSVGRVMRVSPGKKYGYIIIPVVIPAHVSAEDALNDNERFKVVWTVLNALRAHDDRFNAMVNKLELNKKKPGGKDGGGTVLVGAVPDKNTDWEDESRATVSDHLGADGRPVLDAFQKQFALQFEQLQGVIYARMVKKVGDKRYWEQWAASVGDIAKRHIERIKKLVDQPGEHKDAFNQFVAGLRSNINPAVTDAEAIEMLAQHIITKPVFEALFENYSFVKNNPVSVAMQTMVDLLEEQSLTKDQEVLQKFYDSVRMRATGIDNSEARQRIIVELYDKFFRTAFPLVVEKLGIVYTPVEVVDFIIHSVASVLKSEFGRELGDENVHILDPFTGTGTFLTRLLQSGHISPEAMARKYQNELHANEIVLLAYYIASINIENVYHDLMSGKVEYKPFPGICLTDTFQLYETQDNFQTAEFRENSSRIDAQRKAPLTVILGNPPYSVGQGNANDNAQNQSYRKLEDRIEETYARNSKAGLSKSLYDSYIKAFRWSSDRLDLVAGGIIAFVSNGYWIDGAALDGFRGCLEREFTNIHVFNLRGNARTSGEVRQKEAGNIFGGGSRTPIAITLLVRNPQVLPGKATIKYLDIGDYLSREEKLNQIKQIGSVTSTFVEWRTLVPDTHDDWLTQRSNDFEDLLPIQPKKKFGSGEKSVFCTHAIGLATNRDSWVYGFNSSSVAANMGKMIDYYNEQRVAFNSRDNRNDSISSDALVSSDPSRIAWTRALRNSVEKNIVLSSANAEMVIGHYRPFCKQHLFYHSQFIESPGLNRKFFPNEMTQNRVITIPSIGSRTGFSVLMTNNLPDLHISPDGTQCFPLYWYEMIEAQQAGLFESTNIEQYTRRDAITDFVHNLAKDRYGHRVSKDDIFYYVYGFLHSQDYRTRYAADLKKMLPRLPLVENPADFLAFSQAGRELAGLHIGYESVEPYPLTEVGSVASLRVEKMRWASKTDKTSLIYNNTLTLAGIPDRAHEYIVNGKSALEWLIDRYQVTTHPESKIKNDPNDWCDEVGRPRYIIDLVKRIVTVSLKTLDIVESLPRWEPEQTNSDDQTQTVD